MGYKGTIRSLNSTLNKIDRQSQRRQRERERNQKEYQKMQEQEQAVHEVNMFENHIDTIQSLHKEKVDIIDWNAIASEKAPVEPLRSSEHEDAAQKRLENFKPNIIQRLFKREEKVIQNLEKSISEGQTRDEQLYQEASKEYRESYNQWLNTQKLATGILAHETNSILEALSKFGRFSEIAKLGSKIEFNITQSGHLSVNVYVHSKEIVPTDIKSLLKSGKLSVKQMPKGRYYEIFQDHVCSVLIRVAREVFGVLPLDLISINAIDELLNTKTGHMVEACIVSLLASRQTIEKLNLDYIDPSDAVENFVHNMEFKKTTGFKAVDTVKLETG